jgi:amino acid permease-like protein
MIVGLVVAAAMVSIGFARYVGYFVDIDARLASLVLLVIVSLVAMVGIKQSARLTVGLSAVQVGALVFVAAIGLPHVGDVDLFSGPGLGGVLAGAALVFFAFIGFDEVITLAEETRDPTRTVPRALLLALGLSMGLYVAVAIAAVSVLGAEALVESPRPLADVMAHVLGDRGATVVAAIAVLTTTNTTLLALTAASRVMYGQERRDARIIRGRASNPPDALSRHRCGDGHRDRVRGLRRFRDHSCRDGLCRLCRVSGREWYGHHPAADAPENPRAVRRRRGDPRCSSPARLGARVCGTHDDATRAARHCRRHRGVCHRSRRRMADQIEQMKTGTPRRRPPRLRWVGPWWRF